MNNPCTSDISVLIKWLPALIECFYNVFFLSPKGCSLLGPLLVPPGPLVNRIIGAVLWGQVCCVHFWSHQVHLWIESLVRNYENRSVGSTFGPTRSTCEWNHGWRNMSENRTCWNQLPVDGTASHPTITRRALPMMWPIIHQWTIWESLMNQFWMNITEWPRFLHSLVAYNEV
jgi:hypothetical protein